MLDRSGGASAEAWLNEGAQSLLARALEAAANAVFIADRDGRIVWVNDAFCRLSGYNRDEAIGRTPGLLKSGQQSPDFYRQMWETILSGRTWQGELVERRRDGSLWTASQVITPLLDESGHVTHFVAIQHDVSASSREHEEIRRLAYHDSLTGLPNRASFLDSLGRAIALHPSSASSRCCISISTTSSPSTTPWDMLPATNS